MSHLAFGINYLATFYRRPQTPVNACRGVLQKSISTFFSFVF
jgi:hypothetical protein